MANVPPDYELSTDERGMPLLWLRRYPVEKFPDVPNDVLKIAFGDGRSKRLKSFGHRGDYGLHWLITRSGTTMHRDPAYARYTHHLVIRNDGWRLRGFTDLPVEQQPPPLNPGSVYCLDTHSPHQVVDDPRLDGPHPAPRFKVQLAFDTNDPVDPADAWNILRYGLAWDIRDTIHDVTDGPAPRWKPPPIRRTGPDA